MLIIRSLILIIFLIASSIQADDMCTEDQQAPAGKPDNFNLNQHLATFDTLNRYFQTLSPQDALIGRAFAMMHMFRTGAPHDLKKQPFI